MAQLTAGDTWAGTPLAPEGCPSCGRVFLVPSTGLSCPHCAQAALEPSGAAVRAELPELIVPFQVDEQGLVEALHRHVYPVWFKPAEMKSEALAARARRVMLPLWLVDAQVRGHWRGEAGYDYEVESARESFKGGQWVSETLVETRIRWEERAGTIQHAYDNVPVPALAEAGTFEDRLGAWSFEEARACEPAELSKIAVRVPDVDTQAAWPQGEQGLKRAASVTCQDAASAQHMREYYLAADFEHPHWTWLLVPLWVSSYTDHRGQSHPVWVHGTSGKTWGPRVSSAHKGLIWAGLFAAIGVAIIALGALVALAGVVLLPLLPVGGVIALLGCVPVLVALWPALWPWWHNRGQRQLVVQSRRPV